MKKNYQSLLATLTVLSAIVAPIVNLSAGTPFSSQAVSVSVKQQIANSLVIQSSYTIAPSANTTATGYIGEAISSVVLTDTSTAGQARTIIAAFTNDTTNGFTATTDSLTLKANVTGTSLTANANSVSIFPTLSTTGVVTYTGSVTNQTFKLTATYSGTAFANFENIKTGQLTLTSQDSV
jgi:hypothetical protein